MVDALAKTGPASADDAAWAVAASSLSVLYGDSPRFAAWLQALRALVDDAIARRTAELKRWDAASPPQGWWRQGSTVGYSAYVDRFGGTLRGVEARLDYLTDLGVTYLHLLPFMKPRAGESDGGYAVADFEDVNPALGDLADLRALLDTARNKGVQVVADLVCNHVADDHRWARAAKAGDPNARAFFHVVESEAEVADWEGALQDVFPDSAPGNFTWSEDLKAFVWTSFYPYQWDLNYANPQVFTAMTSALLNLANLGLGGFRLDSTGFLWKRQGTSCRNLPEVHHVLAAWRAILDMVAPGVVLKAEAIDRLEEVLPYFGPDARPECDLAYANGVMAGAWTALALGDAEPVRRMIAAGAVRPAHGAWVNYVRCHDDVIFSGLSPHVDRARQAQAATALTRSAADAFGTGEIFQVFDGVPSINGMAASLTGADDVDDPLGAARLLLLYGLCFALDGAPIIFMGDEIALGNDESFRTDPARAAEGRWLGRPAMDWAIAEAARAGQNSRATRIRAAFQRYATLRARHAAFDDLTPVRVLPGQSDPVLVFERGAGPDRLVVAANFGAAPATARHGLETWSDLLSGEGGQGPAPLEPYAVRWLEVGR